MSNSFSHLHRKFLFADHENNGLALILLIDKPDRELRFGSRAIVGERSVGGTGWQIIGSLGAVSTEKDEQRISNKRTFAARISGKAGIMKEESRNSGQRMS